MKVSADELKKNDTVFLNIGRSTHYSVINEMAANSVKLVDPRLGNIVISKKMFKTAQGIIYLLLEVFMVFRGLSYF